MQSEKVCYISGSPVDLERWSPVSGYEGLYVVSSLGAVARILFKNNRVEFPKVTVLSQTDNGQGYLAVGLSKNGIRKMHYVHRLVAEHFVPNPHGMPVVNHLDRNKQNNNAGNLEWVTQGDNVRYSAKHMQKPKERPRRSRTGYRYVTTRIDQTGNPRFRLCIPKRRVDRSFCRLQEALQERERLTGIPQSAKI